ncbi:MAG TPA: hypothetical protein VHP11_09645, partial [Tepidisphaeraceae bacterium]|nr:hypothetical protein [Tepidisphaeraceae bacterium]
MTSHRKASVLARKRNLSRAVAPLVERLEDRRLLTALNGDDPTANSIRYRFPGASDEEWGYIFAGPGVEAEVIWMDIDEDTGGTVGTKNDPIDPGARAEGDPNYGSYPWSIHVTKGNLDSYIMATYQKLEDGRLVTDPFGESAGDLRVTDNRNGQEITVSTPEGSGRLFLGGIVQRNENPYPILDDPVGGQPGVIVDDDVDLGRFLFGGTITGVVDIGGTMDMFYAGALLTGGADGVTNIPNNFYVHGDLENLVVKTCIGGVTGTELDGPAYLTQFQLRVD